LALRLSVSTCRLRAVYWFIAACLLGVVACGVSTLVTKRLDIGMGIASAFMAMSAGLQSVLLITK
jgi:hypothetical protein